MKKLIIILFCIVIAAVGITVYLQTQKEESSIENILPEGALVYVQLNDIEKNLKQMASMPFWKAISGINYDLLTRKNIIIPKHKAFIDLFRTQASQIVKSPMTKKLFGREVAFAVYPFDKDIGALVQEMKSFNPGIIEEVLSGGFLATRIDPDVQFAELLSRSFSQYGANVSQGQIEYKGEIIRTITLSKVGVKFSFVRLNDVLVFGMGERAARMSIDAFKGNKPSLAQDPQFVEARSTFRGSSGMVGFLDFEIFMNLLKDQTKNLAGLAGGESEGMRARQQLEDVLAKMSGIKTLAFSSELGPIMKFNTRLLIDPRKTHPEYAHFYTCPSQVNKTINFIPKEVLGYQWSNCFDLDYYWKEIKKEVERTSTAALRVDELEEKIGFSIEGDILPAFGDEIGGYVSDIQISGFFPIPKFLFFIKIKNKSKAEHLLARLKEQPLAILQDENYDGIALKYLALPFGEDVQPGYCFLDNYLLMASSRQLLKSSIDASGNASVSLLASPDFKEINFGLTDKNRSVQFVKIGTVIEKIKGVIGWSNDWMNARNRKAQAFKMGSEKPLEEVKAGITVKTGELQDMRDNIILLEDEVWNLESKGEDMEALQTQINDLKSQIEAKELELSGDRERQQELENILQESARDAPDPALNQLYLDEVIYPVLESLKSIKSYGLRVTSDKDSLESSVFLKVSD